MSFFLAGFSPNFVLVPYSSTHLLLLLSTRTIYDSIICWPRLRCDFVQKRLLYSSSPLQDTQDDNSFFLQEDSKNVLSQVFSRWMITRLCWQCVCRVLRKKEKKGIVIALSRIFFRSIFSFHVKYFVHIKLRRIKSQSYEFLLFLWSIITSHYFLRENSFWLACFSRHKLGV